MSLSESLEEAARVAFDSAGCHEFFDQQELQRCEKDQNYSWRCDEILCHDRHMQLEVAFK